MSHVCNWIGVGLLCPPCRATADCFQHFTKWLNVCIGFSKTLCNIGWFIVVGSCFNRPLQARLYLLCKDCRIGQYCDNDVFCVSVYESLSFWECRKGKFFLTATCMWSLNVRYHVGFFCRPSLYSLPCAFHYLLCAFRATMPPSHQY